MIVLAKDHDGGYPISTALVGFAYRCFSLVLRLWRVHMACWVSVACALLVLHSISKNPRYKIAKNP